MEAKILSYPETEDARCRRIKIDYFDKSRIEKIRQEELRRKESQAAIAAQKKDRQRMFWINVIYYLLATYAVISMGIVTAQLMIWLSRNE